MSMAAELRQRWRGRRAWLLLPLALLVAGVLCEVAGWPFLKEPLQRQLQRQLARDVAFGERFRLSLIGPPRLRSDRLTIGPPSWARAEWRRPLLQAENVFIRWPWATLWGGRPLHVAVLEVEHLDALLHREADGRANWRLDAPTPSGSQGDGAGLPSIDRLLVRNGRIDWIDRPLRMELHAEVRTDEGRQARRERDGDGMQIDAQGRWRGQPLSLQLSSPGVLPLLAPGTAGKPAPVQLQASSGGSRFSFDGEVVDVLRLAGLRGETLWAGPSLAATGELLGMTLPSTAAFEASGHVAHTGSRWQLELERLNVGRSRLAGRFDYDTAPSPPRLEGELRGQRLLLADLAPAFGARNARDAPPAAPAGRVLPTREFDIPSLRAMDADVRVSLQEARLGKLFAEPLQPLQGVLRLDGGVLRLDELLARTAGGQLLGTLSLDAREERSPRWAAELQWSGIRLERWLSPRNPFAQQALQDREPPPHVAGVLGGRVRLQGSGHSTAALLGSLDGSAAGWVQDGRLSHRLIKAMGADIAQDLGLVVRGDAMLPLHCATLQLRLRNGELRPELALIDTPDSTVMVGGMLSLQHETLGLELAARPKDRSPLTLRTPLCVEGSFARPRIRPDRAAVGGKVLAAASLPAVTPRAALIPLFDLGRNGESNGCQDAVRRFNARDGSSRDAPTAASGVAPPALSGTPRAQAGPSPTR